MISYESFLMVENVQRQKNLYSEHVRSVRKTGVVTSVTLGYFSNLLYFVLIKQNTRNETTKEETFYNQQRINDLR